MLGKEEIVSPSLDELKEHYHRILTLLGEDAGREGLQKTPERRCNHVAAAPSQPA